MPVITTCRATDAPIQVTALSQRESPTLSEARRPRLARPAPINYSLLMDLAYLSLTTDRGFSAICVFCTLGAIRGTYRTRTHKQRIAPMGRTSSYRLRERALVPRPQRKADVGE